jgi:hypothetical protein
MSDSTFFTASGKHPNLVGYMQIVPYAHISFPPFTITWNDTKRRKETLPIVQLSQIHHSGEEFENKPQ